MSLTAPVPANIRELLATYRLQMHSGFDFDAAAAIADYLHELGVSHVYSSPYLQAAPGSQHGYDVVDPHRVNAELGGEEAHAKFCQRLGEFHLGQILDIVPNHMAIAGQHNQYWWTVLRTGPPAGMPFILISTGSLSKKSFATRCWFPSSATITAGC